MKIQHKKIVTAACGCQSCVNRKNPKIHAIYKDKIIYFCNEECKVEFMEDEEEFFKSHFKISLKLLDNVEDRIARS